MRRKRGIKRIIIGGLLAVFFGTMFWVMGLPWTANHFGYALAGAGGLPWRVSYNGRDYSSLYMCAQGGWCPDPSGLSQTPQQWCENASNREQDLCLGISFSGSGQSENVPIKDLICWKASPLKQQGDWPLVQKGFVFTWIGAPYAILLPRNEESNPSTPTVIFVTSGDGCYIAYELEGGP